MVVIVGVAILILGITYYQTIQGLFSSVIMAILTVLCAAVAVNFYEPVASALLYTRQPAYADAIALTAIFVLPLLALRLGMDKLIGGNVVLDRWMDRLGGALAGLVTSIILVGIFMLAVQMLPFNASLIGYQPFNETLERKDRLVPFYPDEFTIGLGTMFSDGAFGGQRKFAHAHDNLLLELFCARNRPNKERKVKGKRIRKGPRTITSRLGRLDARPGHLLAATAYECEPDLLAQLLKTLVDVPPVEDMHPLLHPEPLAHEKKNGRRGEFRKIIVVRTQVSQESREEKGSGAVANWWLLPATQFRLVGESGKSFYPVGYLTYLDREKAINEAKMESLKRSPTTTPSDKPVEVKLPDGTLLKLWAKPQQWRFIAAAHDKTMTQWSFTELMVEREWTGEPKELVVDWVYRVPVKEVPAYMVFRRVARVGAKVVTREEAEEVFKPKEFGEKALDRRI